MMDVVGLKMLTACKIETVIIASRVNMLEVQVEEDNFGACGHEQIQILLNSGIMKYLSGTNLLYLGKAMFENPKIGGQQLLHWRQNTDEARITFIQKFKYNLSGFHSY